MANRTIQVFGELRVKFLAALGPPSTSNARTENIQYERHLKIELIFRKKAAFPLNVRILFDLESRVQHDSEIRPVFGSEILSLAIPYHVLEGHSSPSPFEGHLTKAVRNPLMDLFARSFPSVFLLFRESLTWRPTNTNHPI
ncbi:MAG: hypothetical protein AAGL10_10680 [Pseudomonadota bacterium]